MLDDIEPLKLAALADFQNASDLAGLDQAKGNWIGPRGKFTALMKQLGTLPKEERPDAGKRINQAKQDLESALAARRTELELKAALPKEPTDVTLPGRRRLLGRQHPLTQVTEDIVRSFRKIGFAVADGPEGAADSRVVEFCDKLLIKTPTHVWALNSKGLTCNELGKHTDALNYYSPALRVEPNNITSLLNKALTLSFLGKYDESIPYYDEVQKQEKLSEAAAAKSEAYQAWKGR